ncbi:hypothetical protein EKD16_02295 [Streptomonospora litoralis]|uniref:DUF2530 domain-containing protein n=2 Tax=Streptomonospora litoralis TaxID=2498135 RepID=A0A4P6PW09_9ACTN|nr:hypothetical protein EKD16_02295 [Streptomonospora litoralis]
MESDYRLPTALGTAAWTVALVALLAMGERLPEEDRWWRWVCLTGIAFGVFAFVYIPRHLRNRAERGRPRAAEAAGVVPPADARPEADAPGGEAARAADTAPARAVDEGDADPPEPAQRRSRGTESS